jgi:hypothetical protein
MPEARGLDVTTEAYPYVAGFASVNSAPFNPGWREKLGVGYDALMLPDSGERLTQQRFEQLQADPAPTEVLIVMSTPDRVDAVIANPLVMIASDGERRRSRQVSPRTPSVGHALRNR